MNRADENLVITAWKLPLMIAAIAVTIVGGFYIGGPGLGLAVGAAAAATILVAAVRAVPRGPIVPAPLHDLRRHVLIVTRSPLEDPRTVGQVATLCEGSNPLMTASEVRVLVPISTRLLDRWSGERRPSRVSAERCCVLSLASLTQAGQVAKATIGDEDVILAVEDELRVFPATDVILVTHAADFPDGDEIAAELRARLQTDFLQLEAQIDAAAATTAVGRTSSSSRPGSIDPLRGRPRGNDRRTH